MGKSTPKSYEMGLSPPPPPPKTLFGQDEIENWVTFQCFTLCDLKVVNWSQACLQWLLQNCERAHHNLVTLQYFERLYFLLKKRITQRSMNPFENVWRGHWNMASYRRWSIFQWKTEVISFHCDTCHRFIFKTTSQYNSSLGTLVIYNNTTLSLQYIASKIFENRLKD